jgi:predicted DCC family thiol-disulfide oxidoreductase YuxK
VSQPPDKPTLIYEDRCAFCRQWARRLRQWDRKEVLELLPLQDARAEEVSGLSSDALSRAVHLVRPDGTVFAGAAAAREALRYVRGGWLIVGLLALPGAMLLAERLYRWVARVWGPVR